MYLHNITIYSFPAESAEREGLFSPLNWLNSLNSLSRRRSVRNNVYVSVMTLTTKVEQYTDAKIKLCNFSFPHKRVTVY